VIRAQFLKRQLQIAPVRIALISVGAETGKRYSKSETPFSFPKN